MARACERQREREREISKHAKRSLLTGLSLSPPPEMLSLCAVLQSAESVSCLTLPSPGLITALNVKSLNAPAWHYPALSSFKETEHQLIANTIHVPDLAKHIF